MSKIKSRKLWSFLIWVIITVLIILIVPESIELVLNRLAIITGIYIGGQSAIDAIAKLKE